ncbi:hypothetical protein ACFL0C_01875 [Patescibacteria group bacterium]
MSKKTSITLYAYHIPLIAIVAVLAVVVFASVSTYNNEESLVLGKDSSKTNKGKSEDKTNNNSKNDLNDKKAKPDKVFANEKAIKHVEVTNKVKKKLEEIAENEDTQGNTIIAEDLVEVAEEVVDDTDEVSSAIEKIENKPKWQVLLFGTDYKNLGALRSHLAQNTNTIRKLVKSQNKLTGEAAEAQVQEQMGEMLQERERIQNVIKENENRFSLLGWAFRFLNGYVGGGLDSTDIEDFNDVPETTESTETTQSL